MSNEKQPQDNKEASPLPPIDRKSIKSGLICGGAVSSQDLPETAVRESVNFHFDSIGGATLRKGSVGVGNQLPSSVLGLYYFVDTVSIAAPNSRLIAVSGTSAYYLNGSTFSAVRNSLTSGKKARFTTFLNNVFMVNGSDATATWDGIVADGFVTTGNALSAPIAQFIENFRGRVWAMGNATYPSRLFYSSVPSAATTPVITWNTDVSTGQWIDISPQDGDLPTGLQRFRNVMLCFKTNRLYRIFDIGQVDPDPYYAVGTSSQESVVETKAGVFFHHASGIYQYNIYGIVQEVSRPVIDYIRSISVSSYANITGWLEQDGDHVCWQIGTVTVASPFGDVGLKGTTYTNCVLRYTISTQVWTTYSYPTAQTTSIRRQPFYTDGSTQFALCGDSVGNVTEMVTGTTDLGKPISYSIVGRWETMDGLLSTRKSVMVANFCHIGGAESNVAYQTEDNDPDGLNDWSRGLGVKPSQLKTINTGFNTINAKGRKIRFRVWGQSTGQPFIYNGYELIDVQHEMVQFSG